MTESFSSQITRYGVSESFIALIDGIRETPGLTERKYRRDDVNRVAQYLVCRNYGKACLELGYLCWAIINYPSTGGEKSSLLDFFWVQESITPARFRAAFSQPYQSETASIELNKEVLQLHPGDSPFAISPTRIGALAVLLEFMVNIAPRQFELLTEIETKLAGEGDKAIKNLSSELQKLIYQYLSNHLISAQQQRRLRYISQWLDRQPGQAPLVNDDTLLRFWQQASTDESSPGFKLYSSVFHEFIEADQALKQSQATLQGQNATTIGFDVEQGEYSPDSIESILFSQSSETQDYGWLYGSPKYLTKAQWALLEPIHSYRPYLKTLTLSFARLFVFAQWQAVIVQAKRQSPQRVKQKLNEIPLQGYGDYYQQLSEQNNNVSTVLLSLIHIFYSHQDLRFLGFTLSKLTRLQSDKIKLLMQQLLAEVANGTLNSKTLFNQIDVVAAKEAAFQQLLQAAKSAFKTNNKDGFKQLPPTNLLDNYQAGFDALQHCQAALNELLGQLDKTDITNPELNSASESDKGCEKFSSDVSIFKEVFEQIYGDIHA